MGARLRCASLTIFTICASMVSLPTRSARISSQPVPFTVAPITLSPECFSTGIDSPVTIDSSTELRPSSDGAVDRNLFARPYAQLVADLHLIERDIVLAAVVAHDARQLGREIEQGADGAAGPAARA